MNDALTISELQEQIQGRANLLLRFHPSFRLRYAEDHPDKIILTENWRDGNTRSVLIERVTRLDKDEYFVGYKCLDLDCKQCCGLSYPSGHHLLLKKDGSCITPRIEYLEFKKKTEAKREKQYAFQKRFK